MVVDVPKAPGAGPIPPPGSGQMPTGAAFGSSPQPAWTFNPSGGEPVTDEATLAARMSPGLRPYAGLFISKGKEFGVDPALLAAISHQETGHGTSNNFLHGHNAMGLSDVHGALSFPDESGVTNSVHRMAKSIGTSPLYKDVRKAATIQALSQKYAPVGAGNDPRGLNKNWNGGVTKFYKMLRGETE